MHYLLLYNSKLNKNPAKNDRVTRITIRPNTGTPVFLATAASIGKLCASKSITDRMVISRTLIPKGSRAPIAAYMVRKYPSTRGSAASPGNPTIFMIGTIRSDIHGRIGVYLRIVTQKNTGMITRANSQVMENPFFVPLRMVFQPIAINHSPRGWMYQLILSQAVRHE
jgi:hypothetical protein